MLVRQLRQLCGGYAGGETLDVVVARMHAHHQTTARADGGFIVTGVGAVGGADFVQLHPGAGHDVRDAKGAADFDQLAPGNDAFLARAEAVEGEQHGGGIVVDHGHRFRAGQLADQAFDQIVAVATLATVQVKLQIQRITRGHLHRVYGFFGQQGAPQVGVQHRAGEVEHPAYMAAMLAGQSLTRPARQHGRSQFNGVELSGQHRLAQVVEQLPQAGEQGIAPIAFGQRLTRRVA